MQSIFIAEITFVQNPKTIQNVNAFFGFSNNDTLCEIIYNLNVET